MQKIPFSSFFAYLHLFLPPKQSTNVGLLKISDHIYDTEIEREEEKNAEKL